MDARGWKNITFRGNYPVGELNYSDPGCPVTVKLEAYSPFNPLNTEDSSLPATICAFTVTNLSPNRAKIKMVGFLQNACSMFRAKAGSGGRVHEIDTISRATVLRCGFHIGRAESTAHGDATLVTFEDPCTLHAGDSLTIVLS